jgi:hypothetical protein
MALVVRGVCGGVVAACAVRYSGACVFLGGPFVLCYS